VAAIAVEQQAGAGCRVAFRRRPRFAQLAQGDRAALRDEGVADFARYGDVVIAMGAGSIGAVPQKLVDLLGVVGAAAEVSA
jgi:UDP-N-acetylmuramate-alanine ligase